MQSDASESKDYGGEVRMLQDIRRQYIVTRGTELLLLPNLEH
jgi:hypothetical protein